MNKDEHVYCTNCLHFRLDDEEIPYCPFEDECDINDCEDSKSYEDRPCYKSEIKDIRTDEELLEFKDKTLSLKDYYKRNPDKFAEEILGIKLYPWQKVLLNTWNNLDHCKEYICNLPYRYGKKMIGDAQLEYMKLMEMDFHVWKSDCIEVYEKRYISKDIKIILGRKL